MTNAHQHSFSRGINNNGLQSQNVLLNCALSMCFFNDSYMTLLSLNIKQFPHVILIFCVYIAGSFSVLANQDKAFTEYKQKHQQLIPKVLVADIYYGCIVKGKQQTPEHSLNHMISVLTKDSLAQLTLTCLGDTSIQSEQATDYGLYGCFASQMAFLEAEVFHQKMAQVDQLIETLAVKEKQKSLSQCVSDQAIAYID